MQEIIRLFYLLIGSGLVLGLIFNIHSNMPKIPGDIYFDKSGFRIYIPFASAIVLSAVITVLLNFLQK